MRAAWMAAMDPSDHWGVQYAVSRRGIPASISFRYWIDRSLAFLKVRGAGTVRIVDEQESAALNLAYRGKSAPTNVLSFVFEPPIGWSGDYLGDLVICAPVVQREALEQRKSPRAHWAHLTVHGVLHLLGYDHLDPRDAQEMESREIQILQMMGFADPYQDSEDALAGSRSTLAELQENHVFQ